MKSFLAFILVVVLAMPAFAQQSGQSDDKIVVKKSDLTSEQLEKVQARDKIDTAKEVVTEVSSWGKEAGTAFNTFFASLTDQTIRLSNTEVGKFAMFMIAWKVMAKDLIGMSDMIFGYLVGIPLLFVGGAVLVWSYRRQTMPRRVLIERSKEGKKWSVVSPNGDPLVLGTGADRIQVSGRAAWATGHAIAGALFLIFCSFMIFGC